jgi:hypothetical protein
MGPVTLTIHRAASEIGGNCIEVAVDSGERLLLDIGRPLDAARGATVAAITSLFSLEMENIEVRSDGHYR